MNSESYVTKERTICVSLQLKLEILSVHIHQFPGIQPIILNILTISLQRHLFSLWRWRKSLSNQMEEFKRRIIIWIGAQDMEQMVPAISQSDKMQTMALQTVTQTFATFFCLRILKIKRIWKTLSKTLSATESKGLQSSKLQNGKCTRLLLLENDSLYWKQIKNIFL